MEDREASGPACRETAGAASRKTSGAAGRTESGTASRAESRTASSTVTARTATSPPGAPGRPPRPMVAAAGRKPTVGVKTAAMTIVVMKMMKKNLILLATLQRRERLKITPKTLGQRNCRDLNQFQRMNLILMHT